MSVEIQKLLNGPALAPPPGVIPNFVNPDNAFVSYVVTVVLCVSTSTLVFWMRMYTKIYILQRLGWEDCKFSPFLWVVLYGLVIDLSQIFVFLVGYTLVCIEGFYPRLTLRS